MGPKKNPDPNWRPPSPQGTAKPHAPVEKSHDLSRAKCCLVCMRFVAKSSMSEAVKNGILSLFGIQFDFSDRRVPLGICATCQRGIYDYNKTGVNSKKLELHQKTKEHNGFNYIKIAPATRSAQVCSCEICLVAKGPVKAGNFRQFPGPSKKVLTPIPENSTPHLPTSSGDSTSKTATPTPKPTGTKPKIRQEDLPKCPKCLDPLGPGLHKACNKQTLEKNLAQKCEENPTVGNKVATRTLRSKELSRKFHKQRKSLVR